jgi:hypothetical protein
MEMTSHLPNQEEEIKRYITNLYVNLNRKAARISGALESRVMRWDSVAGFKSDLYELVNLASFNPDFANECKPACKTHFAYHNEHKKGSPRDRMLETLETWDKVSALLRKHNIIVIKGNK